MEAAVIIPRTRTRSPGSPKQPSNVSQPAKRKEGWEEQDRNPIQDRRCLPIMSGSDEVDAIPLHPIITMP